MPHMHHSRIEIGEIALSLALVLIASVYMRGWLGVRKHHRNAITGWNAGSFLLGLFGIWLAMASPLASFDRGMLTGHMVQHLLLMIFIPPLLWSGSPGNAVRHGLPQALHKAGSQLVCSTAILKMRKAIAHPAVCWLAATAALIGWHIPLLFALGMRSDTWHGLEQASFLFTGLLFWRPVMRPRVFNSNSSEWMILLYLFLATLPCDILSGFLVFCDRVVYPGYASPAQFLGFSPLEDQQLAGALMWTCVTVVYLVAGTIYAARLLSPEPVCQPSAVTSEPQGGVLSKNKPWTLEAV